MKVKTKKGKYGDYSVDINGKSYPIHDKVFDLLESLHLEKEHYIRELILMASITNDKKMVEYIQKILDYSEVEY